MYILISNPAGIKSSGVFNKWKHFSFTTVCEKKKESERMKEKKERETERKRLGKKNGPSCTFACTGRPFVSLHD